nr:hypothetical protein [Burkholderia plantarii]
MAARSCWLSVPSASTRCRRSARASAGLGAGAGDEGKGVLAELRIGLARVDLERLRLDAGLGGIDGLAVLLGHADDAQLSAPVGGSSTPRC